MVTQVSSSSISQNGDDAIELYFGGSVIETFGVYIEKDLSINDEIEKLRLSATSGGFINKS